MRLFCHLEWIDRKGRRLKKKTLGFSAGSVYAEFLKYYRFILAVRVKKQVPQFSISLEIMYLNYGYIYLRSARNY